MRKQTKKSFLQIRVSDEEKKAIQDAAEKAGMDMSCWVLSQVLSKKQERFQQIIQEIKQNSAPSYALASLNDFLTSLNSQEFNDACKQDIDLEEDSFLENYVAAMIEQAAILKHTTIPEWTKSVAPLKHPYFPTDLKKMRLYLLTHALVPFRRRNIFVDTSVGGRV